MLSKILFINHVCSSFVTERWFLGARSLSVNDTGTLKSRLICMHIVRGRLRQKAVLLPTSVLPSFLSVSVVNLYVYLYVLLIYFVCHTIASLTPYHNIKRVPNKSSYVNKSHVWVGLPKVYMSALSLCFVQIKRSYLKYEFYTYELFSYVLSSQNRIK